MLTWVLMGGVGIVVLMLITGWLARRSPASLFSFLFTLGLLLLAMAGLALVLAGSPIGVVTLVVAVAPLLIRAMRLHHLWRALRHRADPSKAEPFAPPTDQPMDRAQAYQVLGLKTGASPAQIRAAHRQLMQANHPDRGGSTWIAARLNQARDLLLQ